MSLQYKMENTTETHKIEFFKKRYGLYYTAKMTDRELLEKLAETVIKTGNPEVIHELCKQGNYQLVDLLLRKGAKFDEPATQYGTTPLHVASRMGHLDIVKLLLDLGAYIDRKSHCGGCTPLNFAIENGFTDIVKLLLERGADPLKAETDTGATPLNAASYSGNIGVVKLLLEHDVDPNQDEDDDGATPLFSACRQGHIDVAELLLKHGADPNDAKDNGTTPLMGAMRLTDDLALKFAKLLLSFGGDTVVISDEGDYAVDIAKLYRKTETYALLDSVHDFTPIQICAKLGLPDQLRWLLRRQEHDTFARGARGYREGFYGDWSHPRLPNIIELAAGNKPMLKLCREIQLGWEPCRHRLFHPAFRSTVKLLFLIRSCASKRGLAGLWIQEIPEEIWVAIASQMSRVGWPKLGRKALTY